MPSERFRKKTIDRIKKKKEDKEEESERLGGAGTGAFGPKKDKKPSLLRRFLNKEAPDLGPVQTKGRQRSLSSRLKDRRVKRRENEENQEDAAGLYYEQAKRRYEERILAHVKAGNTVEDAETAVDTEDKTRKSLGIDEDRSPIPPGNSPPTRTPEGGERLTGLPSASSDRITGSPDAFGGGPPMKRPTTTDQEVVDQADTITDPKKYISDRLNPNRSVTERPDGTSPGGRHPEPTPGRLPMTTPGAGPGITGMPGGGPPPIPRGGPPPAEPSGRPGMPAQAMRNRDRTPGPSGEPGTPAQVLRSQGRGGPAAGPPPPPVGRDAIAQALQGQMGAARGAEEQARLPQNYQPMQGAGPGISGLPTGGPPPIPTGPGPVGPPSPDPGDRQAIDDFLMNIEPNSLPPQFKQQLVALLQQLGR